MTWKSTNDVLNGIEFKKHQMIEEIFDEVDRKMQIANLPESIKDAVHSHLNGYLELANFDEIERLYDETVLWEVIIVSRGIYGL